MEWTTQRNQLRELDVMNTHSALKHTHHGYVWCELLELRSIRSEAALGELELEGQNTQCLPEMLNTHSGEQQVPCIEIQATCSQTALQALYTPSEGQREGRSWR